MTKKLLKSSIITLILIMTFMVNTSVFADAGVQLGEVKVVVKIDTIQKKGIDVNFKMEGANSTKKTDDKGEILFTNAGIGDFIITPYEFNFNGDKYLSLEEEYTGTTINNETVLVNIEYKKAKKVTFESDDKKISEELVRHGKPVDKPTDPKKEGYKFEGWQLDGVNYDFSKFVTEDITLVAVWSENTTDPDPVDPVDPNPEPKPEEPKPEEPETKPDKDNTDYSSILWNWRHDSTVEIKTSTHRAYINGYPDGTIRPQGEITRGEVAAIIARLHADAADVDYGVETNYSDVQSTDWYAKYISYVSDKGLMKGYEDESFRPEEKISRAEYATVVARFKNLDEVDSKFDDSKEHWAEGYIGAVYSKGWISGYPDGTFKPNAYISREEVVKMTNGMLGRKVNTEGLGELSINKFTDLEYGTWSYYEMIEASNSHKYLDDKKESETWKEVL
ncbi:MAG: hypothetical protein GXZ08_00440 [Tissierellia bacterium]|nr:hypothetical protein [Tissierellia bacterium]